MWMVASSFVSDAVVHAMANVQQALLLFVSVMHPQLTNLLLDDTRNLVINQIRFGLLGATYVVE